MSKLIKVLKMGVYFVHLVLWKLRVLTLLAFPYFLMLSFMAKRFSFSSRQAIIIALLVDAITLRVLILEQSVYTDYIAKYVESGNEEEVW